MPTTLMSQKALVTRPVQRSPRTAALAVVCVALGVMAVGAALARITPEQPVTWTVEVSAP